MSYRIDQSMYMSRSEIEQLRMHLRRQNRNEIMLELMLLTGARPSEILALDSASLLPQGEVKIIGLKGSLDRDIPLPHGLMDALKGISQPGRKLFPISYQRLYQIWRNYAPQGKSPKSCRHSMGTHLYDKTKDIRLVQYQLGHKSVTSTEVYSAHLNMRQKMKKALNGLY